MSGYDYVIGDVQGCFAGLQALLKHINFRPDSDRLWFTGDLVARGEDSLGVLRWIKKAADEGVAHTVLGNHDLNLLAVWHGVRSIQAKDHTAAILAADDGGILLDWLRCQPLIHQINHDYLLVHAGIPPQWTYKQAMQLADEVTSTLRNDAALHPLLAAMFEPEPNVWNDALTGLPRLRVIINFLTRMRIVSQVGELNTRYKEDISADMPSGFKAWFEYPRDLEDKATIIFGHWAALSQERHKQAICIDGGFVWGGTLKAYCIQTEQTHAVLAS